MKRNNTSWRHHYVPDFYLQGWAVNDGQLWEHALRPHVEEFSSKLRYPKETGYVSRLNTLVADSVMFSDPDGLEKWLGDEDTNASKVLRKLRELRGDEEPSLPTADEKRVWARFMYLQLERDPERVALRLEHGKEARQFVLENAPWSRNEVAESLFSEQLTENLARSWLRDVMEMSCSEVEKLSTWAWYLVYGDFITTDRPVVLNVAGSVSSNEPASIVSMALAPDRLLICVPTSWVPEIDQEWLGIFAGTFNGRLLSLSPRYVYSASRLEEVSCVLYLDKMSRHYVRPRATNPGSG